MRRGLRLFLGFLSVAVATGAAPAALQLPAFPLPALVNDDGPVKEMSSTGLLRELHRGGVRGSDNLEAADADYCIFRTNCLGLLSGWLESTCRAIGFDLLQARVRAYDGTVFSRLLGVATSLAALREGNINLAMPIGVLICQRGAKWGDLPGDGLPDAYLVLVTEAGMIVYDPPTRQVTSLSEFPNKGRILKIRF